MVDLDKEPQQQLPFVRPKTRAQHAAFPKTSINDNESVYWTEDEESCNEEEEHYGVTEQQARRRDRLRNAFHGHITDNNTTMNDVRRFCLAKFNNPLTRLSALTTLHAELRRRTINISGDYKGVLREFTINATKHQPTRVRPITQDKITELIAKNRSEYGTMIALAWTFAARLTSIHAMRKSLMTLRQVDQRYTEVKYTFRSGKTITSTGAYTLVGLIPTTCANSITQAKEIIFTKPIQHYYAQLRKVLYPHVVRSIRRGALQLLAQRFSPEDLLLISRHTTVSSLYAYLDDGREAQWEHRKIRDMNNNLWSQTAIAPLTF